MKSLTLFYALLATQAYTLTVTPRVNIFEDILLFDGLGFLNAVDNTLSASLQSFTYIRQLDLSALSSFFSSALSGLGIDFGDNISIVLDRAKLFAAVPISTDVPVTINGCNLVLSGSSNGMITRNDSLCGQPTSLLGQSLTAIVQSDTRTFDATIFSSASGFGVISDIDDTVKVTNVLDTAKAVQATFIEAPQPVAGMPELYASLASSLHSPQFIYVSGSPFQLYPFLREFVSAYYAPSNGPIFLRNLTLSAFSSIIDFVASDGVFEYKSAMIDRIKGMYPNKKFLAIGDSTQKDPETYGEAYRKYGDFIACSWIRRVDGANNTNERFAAAFSGVPSTRFRIYNDSDITSLLQMIDIAGGDC